jgi:stage V sporulation protein AD
MSKRIGLQTVIMGSPVAIISTASVVGPKEGEGPLSAFFDKVEKDPLAGADTWEKAESLFLKDGLELAAAKAAIGKDMLDYIISGDLLNQNISSTFGIRELERPFLGIFGACSAMGEGLSIAAMLVDGGFAKYAAVAASSHFCAAEKQFRFPLQLGTQRAPTASWTVTGAGCAILADTNVCANPGVAVTAVTNGKIVDMGVTDANNMGAAMAPAAADTIIAHFRDTKTSAADFDLIITGDLGYIGSELLCGIMAKEGYDISKNHTDCGILIFDKESQDTHNGGSGCACSATVFSGYFYEQLKKGKLRKIMLVPTGALLSPTSTQQGESIPGIAHAVVIEKR